jgi:hypothetical protein
MRLIDADKLLEIGRARKIIEVVGNWYELPGCAKSACVRLGIAHKRLILNAPTVDAVEVADMKEFAEDVVYQFGYYCQKGGRLHITHGGLSTLEWAFDILGWENPHPVPECECEVEGCHEHATCGTPTTDGYKRMCGKHFHNHCAKMDGDGNA